MPPYSELTSKLWTEVRNRQWNNPDLPCMNEDIPAGWGYGMYGLGMVVNGPPCVATITPNNLDLVSYPEYTLKVFMIPGPPSRADRLFSFRWLDESNYYAVQIFDQDISILKVVNGKVYELPGAKSQINLLPLYPEYFDVVVTADQRIQLWHNTVLLFEVQDTAPYLYGGSIAIQAGTGAEPRSATWFVSMSIEVPDKYTTLGVPYFSQIDTRWKSLEYDSAKQWSKQPTIQRWGCALTSAVMMLHYHGFTTLPDKTPITPASLNTWLKQQKGGYVQGGYVNWFEISKLSRRIQDTIRMLPALEYSRAGSTTAEIQANIDQKIPLILEVPGHFILAHGRTTYDALIHDPQTRERQMLVQSEPVLSSRRFVPSHTDLSGLLLVYPKGLVGHVALGDEVLPGYELVPYQENQPAMIAHEMSKPNTSQRLLVSIYNPTQTAQTIELHFYNTLGNSTSFEYVLQPLSQLGRSYSLEFFTERTIDPTSHVADMLKQQRQLGAITREWVTQKLVSIAEHLDQQTAASALRAYFQHSLLKTAQRYQRYILPSVIELIEQLPFQPP